MKRPLRVNVAEIPEDGLELSVEESAETMGLAPEESGLSLVGPLHVNARVTPLSVGVYVQGSAAAVAELSCGRCLKEFHYGLRARFQSDFRPRPKEPATGEIELSDEDLETEYLSGDDLDVTSLVRESLVLALPAAPLCMAACKGLCPVCGGDRNVQACDCRPEGGLAFQALKGLYPPSEPSPG